MIHQTILPFKTEITDERLTSHAGLISFGESSWDEFKTNSKLNHYGLKVFHAAKGLT